MPISTFHEASRAISLEEFVSYVDDNVDLGDLDSVMSAAPMLEALASNKNLLIEEYNENLKAACSGESGTAYSPSSVIFASGNKKSFTVRANLWPTLGGNARLKSLEEAIFSYDIAHNHNFSFMTANYFGSGYETDLWEIDDLSKMVGVVGEHVKLNHLGRTNLHSGKQMYFYRSKDVHVQRPPVSLSASINLLIYDDIDELTDQFFFDLSTSRISGYTKGCATSQRATLLDFAGTFGDSNTAEVLVELAGQHPCQRTRAAALKALIGILGGSIDLPAVVLGDHSPLVRKVLVDACLV